jgi:hypothetical protein
LPLLGCGFFIEKNDFWVFTLKTWPEVSTSGFFVVPYSGKQKIVN